MQGLQFVGINKFIDSIDEITEGYKSISVYFTNYTRSKYYDNQINIEPIGYVLNGDGKNKYVRYYEINKQLPLMKFINFKETKNRKIEGKEPSVPGAERHNKLYRLVIMLEETKADNIIYHKSKIANGNEELIEKLLENYKEDKIRIVDEQNNMHEEDFGDITEIDLDMI